MSALELHRGDAARLFAALGDATRLLLLSRLEDGRSRPIAELAEGIALTRQGVTKHLRVLELAGVVSRRRVGRESRYRAEPAALASARVYLERASAQWDEALARLDEHVGRGSGESSARRG